MKTTRWISAAFLTLLALAFSGMAADDDKRTERRPADRQPADRPPERRPGDREGPPPLGVPSEILEKLTLSTQQKDKVEQLRKEFEGKQKEAVDKVREQGGKLREEFAKAQKDGDRDAIRAVSQKMAELNQGLRKVHQDFDTKFREILTDDQKKQLEELAARRRVDFAPPPVMLMPGIQERLSLSPEQRDKIARLRKEFEDKAKEVLTDEQRKQLEEMQTRGRRPTERLPERKERER
jgi:Spy/CpxP family protein refolding chaperone